MAIHVYVVIEFHNKVKIHFNCKITLQQLKLQSQLNS